LSARIHFCYSVHMFSIPCVLFSCLHKEYPMLQSQSQPPKLLDQVRTAIRTRHYSIRTEATYLSWIKRFVVFHGKRHPRDMGV
jgi:Phage integrase, N-terminal SAM-like domain